MVSFFPIYPSLINTERSGPGPSKLEILMWSFSPTWKVLEQSWSISPSQTVLEQIWSISPASSRSTLAAAAVAACVVLRDLGLDIGASSLGRGTAEAGALPTSFRFLSSTFPAQSICRLNFLVRTGMKRSLFSGRDSFSSSGLCCHSDPRCSQDTHPQSQQCVGVPA